MITFSGICIDARYKAEHLWLKTIVGNGFINNEYGVAKIKYYGEWYEVKPESVCCINTKDNITT